uniref:Uncharacterized protein n=1 Tax=Sinocyclocheilus anshuiensis TaxID=1608454 RepID=A0A671LBT7_9TELE
MHNCDDKTLTHGHSRLLNETLCSPSENCLMKVSTPGKSSKCSIPQVSLSSDVTVKHTVSCIHSEYVADTFQQTMEAQNKKTCSYNSSVSSMEDYHSTVDGSYPTPEARPVNHGSTEEMPKIEMTESKGDKDITLRKNASSEDISVCVEDHAQPFEETVPKTRDSAMHFASSDINPFIHSRTTVAVNTAVHKKQAFGSAANLSCKHSPLNSSNKNMTRCCSVDNGLNIQDSPFSSHLSAYVNHKGLSSTLSSNEYSRDQISSELLLKAASYSSSSSNKQTLTALKCDSYNGASGQVDEIVLVYSSEYESQEHPSPSRCDQGTQTIEVNKDLKRKSHHRRSSTQTPVSKPGNGAPTAWTSLQNMSEHLSDLIHNTSDLLGNIQCMRTGEKPPKYDQPKHCFQVSSGSNYKRDCCTQTSLDIGVQTENAPRSTNATAHEVNVIVKVIGSDICNVSQLDGDAKILKNKCESEHGHELPLFFILYCSLRSTYNVIKIFTSNT